MKRQTIAAGTVLTLFGIAAVQARPSMPTPTPAPVARDSAAGPPRDQSASQVLADTAAQYDAIESSIEQTFQKTIADQKADIAALNAKIQEINKKIEELRQLQDKLNKASARLASKEQKAAAELSKKISAQEARAQELRGSLILRLTPARKKPTPKP